MGTLCLRQGPTGCLQHARPLALACSPEEQVQPDSSSSAQLSLVARWTSWALIVCLRGCGGGARLDAAWAQQDSPPSPEAESWSPRAAAPPRTRRGTARRAS